MRIKSKFAAGVFALLALGGLGIVASPANASTLLCVAHESCGGADLAFTGHGQLSLAALNPDNTINSGFGYNNEKVGFTTSGASNGTQDFTVFQDSTERTGLDGVYGHGNYTVMYTRGGNLPFDLSKGTKNEDGSVTVTADDETSIPYCVSVEDTYPTVNGKVVQRWSLVLRNCFAWPNTEFVIGGKTAGAGGTELPDKVINPNLYQLWAPTEVPGPFLEFQDVALNTAHFRHGFGGHNFVMDDRGWGGSGTWGIAYPENDQLNQEFTIIGCTEPVTVFNTAYYNCPQA